MLYLSRKIGESIIINNSIELKVMEVRGKTVKLGFEFPADVSILRKELYDRIHEENMSAASSGMGSAEDFDMLGALSSPKDSEE